MAKERSAVRQRIFDNLQTVISDLSALWQDYDLVLKENEQLRLDNLRLQRLVKQRNHQLHWWHEHARVGGLAITPPSTSEGEGHES